MGKKINNMMNKLKPKKKIETAKPNVIKKPSFEELRGLVLKKRRHSESIDFYKKKITENTNALKKLEERPNRTAQVLIHEKNLETELEFLKEAAKELEATYDAWYNKNKDLLEIKEKKEGIIKLIRFHESEIQENENRIKKLEGKQQTENIKIYISQIRDEQEVHKKIRDHLRDIFRELWRNRHEK